MIERLSLILVGTIEEPESICENCNVQFSLYWKKSPNSIQVTFCPFCGYEFAEVKDGTENLIFMNHPDFSEIK